MLVRRYMRDPVRHEVVSETKTVDEMTHGFLKVHEMDRVKVLAAIAGAVPRTMVFVRTKRGADRLVSQLKREGVIAGAIHGDLKQSAREKALRDFRPDTTRCSSPPTSPHAGSTSTTSTWSCTSIRRRSRRATSTVRAAPPVPAAKASSSRSCSGTRSSRSSGCRSGSACASRWSRCSRTTSASPISRRSTAPHRVARWQSAAS